jgi:hypothetical protein
MSLCDLAQLVDELEIAPVGDEIKAVIAVRDRLDARIARAVGEFDAAGLYDLDGDLTMQTWLRHHTGAAPVAATRVTLRGRKLRALPVLSGAFHDGRVAGGQVDVILDALPKRHVDLFAEHEAELLPAWEQLTVDETARVMRAWLAMADALDPGPAPSELDNEVHLSTTIGGRGELHGSLDSDLTAVADAAFRVADPKDFELTPPQRRAEAFRTICGFYLDHQTDRRGGRHRPHVNVAMTYEQFVAGTGGTYLDTGGPVSPAEAGALCCDAALHRLVVDGRSAILDYGRSVRTAPVDVFTALLARDQGCRWPGCDRPGSHCDAHHVVWFEHEGRTAIDNLALLCRRHHRKLHRGCGWEAKLLPDATLEITDPSGRVETTRPPGPIPQQFWRTPGGG